MFLGAFSSHMHFRVKSALGIMQPRPYRKGVFSTFQPIIPKITHLCPRCLFYFHGNNTFNNSELKYNHFSHIFSHMRVSKGETWHILLAASRTPFQYTRWHFKIQPQEGNFIILSTIKSVSHLGYILRGLVKCLNVE